MAFPLFTSIRPPSSDSECSYLRDCLNSWRVAGFDPVSASGPSEIEALRALDLPVVFAHLTEDGRPRIGALLEVIRDSGARFAGIINSDCKIIGIPSVAENLNASLSRRLALAWRIDVGDAGPVPSVGFDAFFFDTRTLLDDDLGFKIGDPWWDYWFPLACERMGAEVEVLPPILTHRVHPLNWNKQQFEDKGRLVWRWDRKVGKPTFDDLDTCLAVELRTRFHTASKTICITGVPSRPEEVFCALYVAAQLKEQLGLQEQEVIDAYLEAADAAPTRAEALHGASRFCRVKGRNEEGFQLARKGLAIGRPSNATDIASWLYDYGLLDELAVSGYWSGHYRESLDACVSILASAACPPDERERIAANARFALEKLIATVNL